MADGCPSVADSAGRVHAALRGTHVALAAAADRLPVSVRRALGSGPPTTPAEGRETGGAVLGAGPGRVDSRRGAAPRTMLPARVEGHLARGALSGGRRSRRGPRSLGRLFL